MINNSTDVEEKMRKNSDQLHCKIYFMASSKYREFLPLWNQQGFLSKCSQNLVRELSAQRPEHTHTCATSSQHRYTRNPSRTLVPSLGHLLRSEPWVTGVGTKVCWPQDLRKRLARALVQNLGAPGKAQLKCPIPTQAQRGVTRWRRTPTVLCKTGTAASKQEKKKIERKLKLHYSVVFNNRAICHFSNNVFSFSLQAQVQR